MPWGLGGAGPQAERERGVVLADGGGARQPGGDDVGADAGAAAPRQPDGPPGPPPAHLHGRTPDGDGLPAPGDGQWPGLRRRARPGGGAKDLRVLGG